MSDADRSQYANEVTDFSERELQQLLEITAPPVCLLGGWAVHLHVTDAFQAAHGRQYIGSRDIDLGVHVDPEWDMETLDSKPVATTLTAVGSEMGYNRGRFGFYRLNRRNTTPFTAWIRAVTCGNRPPFKYTSEFLTVTFK
jgi:hypothetical protein